MDTVYLRKVGDPNAPTVSVGTFRYDGPLGAGMSYTRREQVLLPAHTYGLVPGGRHHQLRRPSLRERRHGQQHPRGRHHHPDHPAAAARFAGHRTSSRRPRPTPARAIAVEFTVPNQGNAATTVPHWTDKVCLSLDPTVSSDDILVGSLGNQSALDQGESYRTITGTVVIPLRFRGTVYLIVQADAGGQVDEFPNDGNNTKFVELLRPAAAAARPGRGGVVVPEQVVEGATIEVRYTVTNLGPGTTNGDDWTDTVWLTPRQEPAASRPGRHPAQEPVAPRPLANRAGYDVVTTVKIPDHLVSGTYYLTPWTDPYDVVLEDTLAVNVNPDDPTEIDNNNYKAGTSDRPRHHVIAIHAPDPDLVVASVTPPAPALAGMPYTVSWTVKNPGHGPANGSWSDEVWLTDSPNVDPNTGNGLRLGAVLHTDGLAVQGFYTGTLTVTLEPGARAVHRHQGGLPQQRR